MANKLILTVHDSKGFHMLEGYPKFGEDFLNFESSGSIKLYKTSENGKKVALIANGCVQVLTFPKWHVQHKINQPTAQDLKFSPRGDFLAVYCSYLKKAGQSEPNLHVYSLQSGECLLLKSFFQANQMGWEPQWTGDDKVFCRSVSNEVHFYPSAKLDTTIHKRLQQKVKQFSISPTSGNYSVVFFTPCVKSNPCLVNMFSYPNFEAGDLPLVTKNFFKGESVEFKWNKNGTTVLVSAFCEKPEKTSYYGQTMLYLLSSKTQEAVVIEFPRDSPVADACWAPDGKELVVVHGHTPASCSILNASGDIVHNLKPGARNFVMMNPQGNLALIGAMGNMSPKMEVWNYASRTELKSAPLPDMTHIEWSPCGQHFITSTCAPRLRVLNGFRIYHYSGALKYEHMVPEGTELYSAKWLPDPQAAKAFKASAKTVDGIQSSIKVASSQAYVPPGQRGLGAGALPPGLEDARRFLSQIDKYDPNSTAALANAPKAPLSKNALRNKKKRENKKQKGDDADALEIEEPDFGAVRTKKTKPEEVTESVKLAGDGQKMITAINKKLKRIRVINQLRAEGKELDAQQRKLVDSEKELLAQLSSLKV